MLWFVYSLLCAFCFATSDALSKKALDKNNEMTVSLVRWVYALPFLSLLILWTEWPGLDQTFWIALSFLVPLEITATLLYMRAIKLSPLSLTIPFLGLTPLFSILISFILLRELPDKSGLLGVILIVLGSYLLHIHLSHKGMIEPFKAIGKEKGSILMIIVAFIYSITSNLGKITISHSNPFFFAIFYSLIMSFFLFLLSLLKDKGLTQLNTILDYRLFLPIGFFYGLMVIFHNLAIVRIEVVYMISVKRVHLLFGVLYGRLLFKEEHIKERVWGSIIIILGMILITI